MKTFISITCLLLILSPVSAQSELGFGQVWQKASEAPLFVNKGEPGTWNGGSSWTWNWGHLLQDGDTLRYYLGGQDGDYWSIGMWYTTDIKSGWQEYAGNPVLKGTPGAWDSVSVGMPHVLKDGDTYKMWYVGANYFGTHGGSNSIGYATSSDGVNWTKHPNPVMKPSPPIGGWEWFNFPFVLDEGDTLKMWYVHSKTDPTIEEIYYAYSLDGINWVKYPEAVIQRPTPNKWLASPFVRKVEGKYVLWAVGGYYGDFNAETGVAVSDNGINWRRDHLYNPVLKLGKAGLWDDDCVSMTDVVTIDGIHYGVYVGFDENSGSGMKIGLATYAPTTIPAGTVSGTWSKKRSPYRVQGKITILDGQTLSIEAGATVQFLTSTSLDVNGRIIAEGSEVEPVRFRPVDTLGYANVGSEKGVWGGIRFIDTPPTNERSLLKHCDIEFAEAMGSRQTSGVLGAGVGGGLLIDNYSKVTVDRCLIQYNRAMARLSDSYGLGGGIAIINGASPEILNSVIQKNHSGNLGNHHDDNGGGIWIFKKAHPLISGNIIRQNRTGDTGGGVAIWEDSNPLLINNLIVGNIAKRKTMVIEGYGGGLSIGWDAYPVLINNTIANNSASTVGGGIYFRDASALILNTIIANNLRINALSGEKWGHNIGIIGNDGQRNILYSCLEYGVENVQYGITNLNTRAKVGFHHSFSEDPALTPDYKPAIVSKALGGGVPRFSINNQRYDIPAIDIEGNPRCSPNGSSPDMGAYESDLCGQIMTAMSKWFECPENPVLNLGSYGTWDDVKTWSPDVLYYDGQYHMYYAGDDGNEYRIGHATSKDGILWTKDPNNPIIQGNSSKWYGTHIYAPRVLKVGSEFHMYFYSWARAVGHATSPDGVNWAIADNPVLTPGAYGAWDDRLVQVADVIHDGSEFKMWYSAQNNGLEWSVGYATSPDGVNWTKHENNPVFLPGNDGSWDDNKSLFYANSVIYNGSHYYMWYSGNNGEEGVHNQIGRAYSTNGITWVRATTSAPEIAFGDSGTWNDDGCFYAAALLHEGKYRMWFNGARKNSTGYESIGYTLWSDDKPDWLAIDQEVPELPSEFSLNQNYPNPFNPTTQIRYSLPELSDVRLVVYDMLGREVTELVNMQQGLGNYAVLWNGLDHQGQKMPSGVYLARLTAGKHSETIKMLLLK